MNDTELKGTEEALRRALGARATLVTEESLRLPTELPSPAPVRKSWPALAGVAAAAVLAVTAGLVGLVTGANYLAERGSTAPGSGSTSERPPPPTVTPRIARGHAYLARGHGTGQDQETSRLPRPGWVTLQRSS